MRRSGRPSGAREQDERSLRRGRVGVLPDAHRRHRQRRAGAPGPRDRGGHPDHPRHRARGAADAPRVRLRAPRLRLRARRRGDRRTDRLRGARGAGPVGAPDHGARRPGHRGSGRGRHAAHRRPLHDPRHQQPAQPGVPVLRDPARVPGPRLAVRGLPARDPRRRPVVTMPAPNLDDRRFQELVDDARRFVQQRCPEWSDHNISDPGITLIETFAMVTDQLLYRLNRVPDRLYLKFLELLGIELVPPTPARADTTFWLAAPRQDDVIVRAGTEVATTRTETADAVAFETVEDLTIVACSLAAVATAPTRT